MQAAGVSCAWHRQDLEGLCGPRLQDGVALLLGQANDVHGVQRVAQALAVVHALQRDRAAGGQVPEAGDALVQPASRQQTSGQALTASEQAGARVRRST